MANQSTDIERLNRSIAHLPEGLKDEAMLAFAMRVYMALEVLDLVNPEAAAELCKGDWILSLERLTRAGDAILRYHDRLAKA